MIDKCAFLPLWKKKINKKFRFEGNAMKLKENVEQCQGYLPMVKNLKVDVIWT